MMKLDKKLLPIKAHYFFFMASMGPILPQMPVFAKNMGVSPDIMGLITSVLPILYVLAKPAVGFLADYFANYRKMIFALITIMMAVCFAGLKIIPHPIKHFIGPSVNFNVTLLDDASRDSNQCHFEIDSHKILSHSNTHLRCHTSDGHIYDLSVHTLADAVQQNETLAYNLCVEKPFATFENGSKLECMIDDKQTSEHFYSSAPFWLFVLFICIGTVAFNVINSLSDAICFDVLGQSQEMKYGVQRVWGTIGFGATALLAGLLTQEVKDGETNSMTPAIIIMLIASSLDLLIVVKLKLPKLSSDSIVTEVWHVLRQPRIAFFLVFATIAGIIDSFIIYFMFWHLEEIAADTGYTKSIKLIEGCVVAAECLGGEILFFLTSGKILKRLGYVHCLSLCFFTYSIRLGLISLITNPWWLVVVELFMQGCTYALCYTCIVAYASAIAPPGTSATVQGIVAGMDDGLGFSIGSLVGGQLYKYFGGTRSFQMFATLALVTFFAHVCFRSTDKHQVPGAAYHLPTEQIKISQNTLDVSH